MLSALNRGKVSREIEEMEDVLTSSIFDAIRYTDDLNSDHACIYRFLKEAETFSGDWHLPPESAVRCVDYCFWPRFHDGTEPDLLVTLKTDDETYLILVEAKFKSDKSQITDERGEMIDQLVREWKRLGQYASRHHGSKCKQVLIYLTADYNLPKLVLDESLSMYEEGGAGEKSVPVWLWLSWQHFHDIFANHRSLVVQDARSLLRRLGLEPFDGIRYPDRRPINWQFSDERDANGYSWHINLININWRFTHDE